VPADIWALAQGPGGYLWLGTGVGLYRFDGVRFARVRATEGGEFASNNITALDFAGDDVWLGYHAAGASRLRDGRVTHFGTDQGFPPGMVYGFAEDGDGRRWAATAAGLAVFAGERWQRVGDAWGYPARRAEWVLHDRTGRLWVSTGKVLVTLAPGARRFSSTGQAVGADAVLAEAPDGRLWLSDPLGGTRPMDGEANPALATVAAKRLLFARDGSLWGTDGGRGGVFRVARANDPRSPVEHFGRIEGLTADVAVPLAEDREGNVWVGTNLGLNRFRHRNVRVLDLVGGVAAGFALAAGNDGRVQVVADGRLVVTDGVSLSSAVDAPSRVLAAYAGPDGTLWLVSSGGLARRDGDRWTDIPLPGAQPSRSIDALVADDDGTLFAALQGDGVHALRDGRWTPVPALSSPPPKVMAADGRGGFWLGYPGSRVAHVDAGGRKVYGPAQGLDVGDITALHALADGVVAAGETGVALWRDGRFRSLGQGRDEAFGSVTGILRTDAGDFWFNGSQGVVQLAAAELARSVDDPGHRPQFRLFGQQDGLPGIALQAKPVSTAIAGDDGRLWFATNQGIAWIDPSQLTRNVVPPPVAIVSVSSGGSTFAATDGLRLPPLTTTLGIDYTATSLTDPDRVRFRTRLDGADTDWQAMDGRRAAYYANLGPGDYRFHVIAANNDGVWNDTGATLAFSIAPTFLQTPMFVVLCVASVLALLYVAYLLRLRQLGLHIRTRLTERHRERERIARELHDTLLQSIQGLVLRFQAASETIPPGAPARLAMEQALERADGVLAEGRDRVMDLRASSLLSDDLPGAFHGVARELAGDDDTVRFTLDVDGEAKPLDPIVLDELFRIGREALLNAYQHADAQQVGVALHHGYDEVCLRISDDGRGIDARVLDAGGRPGHWGLRGMRERADRIGATLRVWSRPGAGTEIELRMPAEAAYRPCLKASRRKWLAALFGRRG